MFVVMGRSLDGGGNLIEYAKDTIIRIHKNRSFFFRGMGGNSSWWN